MTTTAVLVSQAIVTDLNIFTRSARAAELGRLTQSFTEPVCLASMSASLTVGFLYEAGAETLIFVTGTSGKKSENFRLPAKKNQSQLWIPRKPRKIGVWVSGAEIQTSAVDTRSAVWVSAPEKFSKIVLGKTRNFSRKFRGVSAPALDKNPAVIPLGWETGILLHACASLLQSHHHLSYYSRRSSESLS